jgi:hypothetical protein
MKEQYSQFLENAQKKVKEQFSNLDHFSHYFMHLLENFSYRYLEDPKCAPAQFENGDHFFQVSAMNLSMKRALELTEQKAELVANMKASLPKVRPTSNFILHVNTSKISKDGEGQIIVTSIINWDFPKHEKNSLQASMSFNFDSEDWEDLRRRFPLTLEDACEFF